MISGSSRGGGWLSTNYSLALPVGKVSKETMTAARRWTPIMTIDPSIFSRRHGEWDLVGPLLSAAISRGRDDIWLKLAVNTPPLWYDVANCQYGS